ncbi:metallophosphoesterase [Mucilaginibacter gossypii]|uniref:metallophosphoesterase family protein n=1 Tax=Mucilaginibacter gossypii TaxID=551996 RepID=UPI000DCBBE34|nr:MULTISPECIES: metallophosphoesterase [Mucilaginibacter]QTE39081.1 metallophosphoesterase [Mucilaginibacter gossypii]RAV53381.1 metallophosphoesterase [Mucilaginibacter rubeus]
MTNTVDSKKRRDLVKGIGLLAISLPLGVKREPNALAGPHEKKRVLRVAHITGVHIRPEYNAPERFGRCIEEIKKHKVDFFLNGGDSIFAADYNNITRERVNEQWAIWKNARERFKGYEVYSCLGNHDMWWACPDKSDSMYGKPHVIAQLEMPGRFYSFEKHGWHFIILDSNNDNAGSLDAEQRKWLENDLASLRRGTPVLCMSHYPILGVSTIMEGGNHTDARYITNLFNKHRDKTITCISGHIHLLDEAGYDGVRYYCNGALSGFWWEDGDSDSAAKCYYRETPPGYAILDLFEDGSVSNRYYPHSF